MDRLERILKQNNTRVTAPRLEIFAILDKSEQPLSIGDITASAKRSERTSIYRTLELFIDLGIVEVISIGWRRQYELSEPFRAHHHHLICNNCGIVTRIDQPKLETIIASISQAYGYSPVTHHVELRGICRSCQKAASDNAIL